MDTEAQPTPESALVPLGPSVPELPVDPTVYEVTRIDAKWYQSAHLLFEDKGKVSIGSKTHKYAVLDRRSKKLLAYIYWHNQWRKYAFFPLNPSRWDNHGLREVAVFIDQQTAAHKEDWKKSTFKERRRTFLRRLTAS